MFENSGSACTEPVWCSSTQVLFLGSGVHPGPSADSAQHLVNRVSTHSQDFGSSGLITLNAIQYPQQVTLLDGLHSDKFFVVAFGRGSGRAQNFRRVGQVYDRSNTHDATAADHILQFPYISRPAMRGEAGLGTAGDS